ncbi:MAG: hypothetical protein EBY21_03300, partial [Alphaproteobacteria bacterium]|nr:hypothetical protein [Alphaproteobacteria bacterium]
RLLGGTNHGLAGSNRMTKHCLCTYYTFTKPAWMWALRLASIPHRSIMVYLIAYACEGQIRYQRWALKIEFR